jgi:tripartite-type tricarboxylate transporter receptor subunit TctC
VASGYYGLLAPARTPQAIIDKLHAAVVAAVNGTEVREKLISQGYEVHASTPAEYAAYLRREIERWTPIVKAAGIKPQ